tara:strand:+ start:1643 stop:1837 length:195 start_codon:yes stop_codon:yes gene_type:complete
MLSIKKMYNYIRRNGTRKMQLELDIILDEMHSMIEELDSKNPLPQQEVRPKTIEELIQQSKGGG